MKYLSHKLEIVSKTFDFIPLFIKQFTNFQVSVTLKVY